MLTRARKRKRDEEDSSNKRAPALTLEQLPNDILIVLFLTLDHGSQFDALRQTSKQFKELANQAVIIRRKQSERVNTNGTYVYKGRMYGTELRNHCFGGKNIIFWFASKQHGMERWWYNDGQLWYESIYKDGEKDDVQRGWYENGHGQLSFKCIYKDRKLNGVYKEWYRNGQLKSGRNYKDGEKDGAQRAWYEGGKPKNEYNYKDGKREGAQKAWDTNEQLQHEFNYKNGNEDGVQKDWFHNGQLHFEYVYVDGKQDGVQKGWHKNGQLAYEQNYKNGMVCTNDGLDMFNSTIML